MVIFLTLSKLLIGNWRKTQILGIFRGYGESPDISVFLIFTPLNFINNDVIYPTQYFSYWNSIYYDFFSDYFQAFHK